MTKTPACDRVLVTGGAGFIGSHLTDRLIEAGYEVRILDALCAQVHGEDAAREGRAPRYLSPKAELIVGDVRDRDAVGRALEGVSAVVHLAAAVGVGQSMYEVAHYTDVNATGTAVLLEALRGRDIRKLVVASSMSIYGEGLYRDGDGRLYEDEERSEEALARGDWDLRSQDGVWLKPAPTPEWKRPALASVYALTKYQQERMVLLFGRTFGVPVVALRFFNTYGPRQALSNPYTGVIAIFASRLANGKPPVIFEDGRQQRDFVHVSDIARAIMLAMERSEANGRALNIGTGRPRAISDVARLLARVMRREEIEPEISGEYRAGDIRHCFADIKAARDLLGFEPEVPLAAGLRETARWLSGQAPEDRLDVMRAEMRRHGVTVAAGAPVKASDAVAAVAAARGGGHNGNGNGNGNGRMNGRAGGGNGDGVVAKGVNGSAAGRERLDGRGDGAGRAAKRALITGGCGFIGTNMAAALAERGGHVVIVDDMSRKGSEANAAWLRRRFGGQTTIIEGDVRDGDLMRRVVDGASCVIHLAAQVAVTGSLRDPLLDHDVNVRGTLSLLEAMRRSGSEAHLLYTSTNKVYGGLERLALREQETRYEPADAGVRRRGVGEASLSFESPYGCSKGAAEQYVLDYGRTFGLRTTVFRMSCIYGPHQNGTEDQGWVAHLARQMRAGKPITVFGNGKQVRDLLYIDDLVEAMGAALAHADHAQGRAFNIGGGPKRAVSLLETVRLLEAALGRKAALKWAPWRVCDQRYYVSDTSAFEEATGWRAQVEVQGGLELLCEQLERTAPVVTGNGRAAGQAVTA